MSLQGKTALISGVGGSLTLDITTALLSQGANVVICAINESCLTAVKHEYSGAQYAERALILLANVSEEDSVRNLVTTIVEKFHRLDVVIHDAAIMGQFDPDGTYDKRLRGKATAVNLRGPFLVTKYATQQMEAQNPSGGSVISIASNWHNLTVELPYSATRHGILVLTKNTARFHGPKGVLSVALLLGGTETTSTEAIFDTTANQDGAGLFGRLFGRQPVHTGCVSAQHVARYITLLLMEGLGKRPNGSYTTLNGAGLGDM